METGIQKRRQYLVLGGSAMSGPEVRRIICINAVGDSGKTAHGGNPAQLRKQLRFAVIASVAVVGDIQRIIELQSLDEFMSDAGVAKEAFHLLTVMRRK